MTRGVYDVRLIHVRALAPEQYEADCPTCGNTTPVVSDARTAPSSRIHPLHERGAMTTDTRTEIPTTGTLKVYACWCGIQFAMPSQLMRWHRQTENNNVYCPLGHSMVARKSEADTLRAKLDQAEADARWQRDEAQRVREALAAEADRAAAARAEAERTRKRLAGGACPCCNRSFVDLARHISGQHPGYVGTPEVPHEVRWASMVWSVAAVLAAAGEPLTVAQVYGRLALAGRSRCTEQMVRSGLYNACSAGTARRVGRGLFAPASPNPDGEP